MTVWIVKAEVGQTPGPLLQATGQWPAGIADTVMLRGHVVDVEDDLDTLWHGTYVGIDQTPREDGSQSCAVTRDRRIGILGATPVLNELESEYPCVEVDEGIEIRHEDL